MDELVAHSHKYRILSSDRSGRRGLQRAYEEDSLSTPPSLVALTHASHVATKPPGCNIKETQVLIEIPISFIALKKCFLT